MDLSSTDSDGLLRRVAEQFGTPTFVYNHQAMVDAWQRYQHAFRIVPRFKLGYAIKANSNIALLSVFRQLGAWVDASSSGEVYIARQAGYEPGAISLTSHGLTLEDIAQVSADVAVFNADSLDQLTRWISYRADQHALQTEAKLGIRINPGILSGLSGPCVGTGPHSKLGLDFADVPIALDVLDKAGLPLQALHMHIGSDLRDEQLWLDAVDRLMALAAQQPSLETLNLGGGFVTARVSWETSFNLEYAARGLANLLDKHRLSHKLEIRIEPGEDLMGLAGGLLTRVQGLKRTMDSNWGRPMERWFATTDTSINHFPGANQAFQHCPIRLVDPLDRLPVRSTHSATLKSVQLTGYLNQSIDLIGFEQEIAGIEIGSLLYVHGTGSYAAAYGRRFCGHRLPTEVLLHEKSIHCIREREPLDEMLRHQFIPGFLK